MVRAAARYDADMTPFTPEQARTILAVDLKILAMERAITSAVIAAIPPDQVDYTPDPVTRSAIELAWHIVMAEDRFLSAVVNGVFDFAPRPRPDTVRTPADVNAWWDERLPGLVERLKSLSDEALTKPIDFRGQFTPARGELRALHPQPHGASPRGQLSMYLRPMGAAVPSIYGESFDARTAREKREAGAVLSKGAARLLPSVSSAIPRAAARMTAGHDRKAGDCDDGRPALRRTASAGRCDRDPSGARARS
jgi:uncharacterized damage-inducible protein DinB